MPTMKKKTEQDFADAAHQQSLAWARLREPKLGKVVNASEDLYKIGWTDEAREAAAAARSGKGKADKQGWKHFDVAGRSVQEGDRVHDIYSGQQATVTSTHFEGGKPGGKPLISMKNDKGVSATRYPEDVSRVGSSEHDEYNRDLALRLRDNQVGSGMSHRD
jgi:hypothetical protein